MARIYDFTPDEADEVVSPAGKPSAPRRRFVCPECHRRFQGKGALRQHTRDKHPSKEENP